jgi:ATP/maltotriose-dependent transcriptional regulator MalT/DNA-binding SARP family transcriptional activator
MRLMPETSPPRGIAFAKTTRPVVGSIVNRERLFARLDGSPGRTVSWISGPPGSGKTTLAASYVEKRGLRCLWYQVDPDDADVATFFHYLGHAARKLNGATRSLPAFSPQYGAEIGSFSRSFFRELFALARAPFALVLDNLHAVPPESALHAVLEAAFSQIPKGHCVVVTCRGEPPATFARLRVTGEMACLGWQDLRVTPEELRQIAEMRGQAVADDVAAQLHERTQGWAAGLVLMLEHAKLAGRLAEPPQGATPQVVFDYLAGEIFERFEPATRQFLLQIACLRRMTAEVAQALTGEPKAARLLLNLALNQYFVTEVESAGGRVFQLHPLLTEFLRRRAAQELPAALGIDQFKRAAALLREAGHLEDAVTLLADCRDWTEVARLAADEAGAMLAQGRSETLAGWLELLPAGVLEGDPGLLEALGACRLSSSPRAARRLYEQAHEGFKRAADSTRMASSCRGVIEATLGELDDLAQLDPWIEALAGLRGADATLAWAMLLRNPADPRLEGWAAQSELARAAVPLARGDLVAAGAALEGLAAEGRRPTPDSIAISVACALQQLLAGSHEKARATARAALDQGAGAGVHGFDGWLHAIAAAAALGAGDLDAARAELQALEARGAELRRGERALVHYLRGWLAQADGDATGAGREAKAAAALAAETGIPWLECLARTAWAPLLAEGGDRRGAEAQLRAAEPLASGALLQFALQVARASLVAEDEAALAGPLGAAFRLGRENGFQHLPWWRARQMADLCAAALRLDIEPEYARSLVRARRLLPQALPLQISEWPWAYRISTLGRFQLLRGDAPVEFAGKGPGRPMELLKVLIALGGQNVRADHIADALWPHVDADYAHKSFTATLHRLRRLLDEEDALYLRETRLGLNPALAWVDLWALEQAMAELDEALRAGREPGEEIKARVDGVLALYSGPFLPDESEQPSYIACREQIRARLLRCLARAARRWEEAGQPDLAADCYQRAIEADDLFEGLYRNLMLCYQRSGNLIEARATYERLRTVLATKLKSAPSAETQAVLERLASPV